MRRARGSSRARFHRPRVSPKADARLVRRPSADSSRPLGGEALGRRPVWEFPLLRRPAIPFAWMHSPSGRLQPRLRDRRSRDRFHHGGARDATSPLATKQLPTGGRALRPDRDHAHCHDRRGRMVARPLVLPRRWQGPKRSCRQPSVGCAESADKRSRPRFEVICVGPRCFGRRAASERSESLLR